MEKSEATHGTAILMEVKTGDIKAIANLARKDGVYIETRILLSVVPVNRDL